MFERKHDLPDYIKDEIRDGRLWSKYKIRLADYERMLDKQGGVCWICQNPPVTKRLAVDHCHETGRVRGLLCSSCNRGLAWFIDDPNRLYFASLYLARCETLNDEGVSDVEG